LSSPDSILPIRLDDRRRALNIRSFRDPSSDGSTHHISTKNINLNRDYPWISVKTAEFLVCDLVEEPDGFTQDLIFELQTGIQCCITDLLDTIADVSVYGRVETGVLVSVNGSFTNRFRDALIFRLPRTKYQSILLKSIYSDFIEAASRGNIRSKLWKLESRDEDGNLTTAIVPLTVALPVEKSTKKELLGGKRAEVLQI
jgi:hypothetical protein